MTHFLLDYKYVSIDQFYGIDVKLFAVELAKVTLMIAKELIWLEAKEDHDNKYPPLPLDNLDRNILCMDALIDENGDEAIWPEADAIIGNPPYQSKNKMQKEFGVEYLSRLRSAFAEVPGRADFCVYWYYKAHRHLKSGNYAGLVGTNTIRQNYSRMGSLDYIVKNGGTIIDAVSSQDWSGDAAVYVSIVNWVKGDYEKEKTLWHYDENNQLHAYTIQRINSSLSLKTDVTSAQILACNRNPKKVFQGQTHGHEGFLMSKERALGLIRENPDYKQVLKPFLIADELLAKKGSQPGRFVIDFTGKDLVEASKYKKAIDQIEAKVLPEIKDKAEKEKSGKIKPNGREAWLNTWWWLWRRREDMLESIKPIHRYITCARVTKRPIFEFVSSEIHPNDALMVFAFADVYSFGVISSMIHWEWFREKCSTLEERLRYTTESVWDTFPWPQNPNKDQVLHVVESARALRQMRREFMVQHNLTYRDLYRILEKPGKHPLKEMHYKLDMAVFAAYGFDPKADLLQQLLELNQTILENQQNGVEVQGPGIPNTFSEPDSLISEDCIRFDATN